MAFDPYGLLGVPSSATREEIRQAYRAQARKYHPDVNDSPDTAERFKEMGMAFAILNDGAKRALFDEFGDESMHLNFDPVAARKRKARKRRSARGGRGAARRGGGGRARQGRGGAREQRPTMPPRPGARPQRPRRGEPVTQARPRRSPGGVKPPPERKGAPPRRDTMGAPGAPTHSSSDVVAPLQVELGLALAGGELRFPSPVGGAMLTVQVPPGVQSGHRLRVMGRGRPGRGGARPGDLFLEVVVLRHPYFHLEADDLVLELPVTVGEAHHGAEVQIPTPEGWLRIRVPPGSLGGERLRLKGKGKLQEGGARGEMYVHLCVRLPRKLGAAARSLEHINQLYSDSIRQDLKL